MFNKQTALTFPCLASTPPDPNSLSHHFQHIAGLHSYQFMHWCDIVPPALWLLNWIPAQMKAKIRMRIQKRIADQILQQAPGKLLCNHHSLHPSAASNWIISGSGYWAVAVPGTLPARSLELWLVGGWQGSVQTPYLCSDSLHWTQIPDTLFPFYQPLDLPLYKNLCTVEKVTKYEPLELKFYIRIVYIFPFQTIFRNMWALRSLFYYFSTTVACLGQWVGRLWQLLTSGC